jgi:hypothetical protein
MNPISINLPTSISFPPTIDPENLTREDKIRVVIIIYELLLPLGSNGKTPDTNAMTANKAAQTQMGIVVVAPFFLV